MRFITSTLGCKVNQYETEWIRSVFLANGWEEADAERDGDGIDLVVVNTCSVTAESDAKSRKIIGRFARQCPNAEIVVVGCFAASDPEGVAALPGVTEIVPDKRRLPEFFRRRGLETIPTGVNGFAEHSRAYVKVQDGCRVGCAYCIIPSTRPYLQSRPLADALAEARVLSANGYREIVLTGIHLGHYGLDFLPPAPNEPEVPDGKPLPLARYLARRDRVPESDRVELADLVRALAELRLPQMRYRLGSLEATEVSDRLLQVAADYPEEVCPHFHLSMQSGDDSVLRAMGRRQLSGEYIDRCHAIMERLPNVALTTDVIVGFPGETDAQFERTCEVVRMLHFSRTHVFRFSPRRGTRAAEMPNQIPAEVKKERATELIRIAKEEREQFATRFVGQTARVIVERSDAQPLGAGTAHGSTARYYDAEFSVAPGAGVLPGDVVDVRLTGTKGDVFLGELVGKEK